MTVPNSTGKPLIVWNFLAYEADRDKAIQLVRRCAPVLEDEIAEPIAQLPAHVFATLGIRPGQVERHDW